MHCSSQLKYCHSWWEQLQTLVKASLSLDLLFYLSAPNSHLCHLIPSLPTYLTQKQHLIQIKQEIFNSSNATTEHIPKVNNQLLNSHHPGSHSVIIIQFRSSNHYHRKLEQLTHVHAKFSPILKTMSYSIESNKSWSTPDCNFNPPGYIVARFQEVFLKDSLQIIWTTIL